MAWPPNETAIWFQKPLKWFCGNNRWPRPPFDTTAHTWLILSLGFEYTVMISGYETAIDPLFLLGSIQRLVTAEWNRVVPLFSRDSIRRFNRWFVVVEWNRRLVRFRGKLIFSPSFLLASINTSLCHSLNVHSLIIKNPILEREIFEIKSNQDCSFNHSKSFPCASKFIKHHLGSSRMYSCTGLLQHTCYGKLNTNFI